MSRAPIRMVMVMAVAVALVATACTSKSTSTPGGSSSSPTAATKGGVYRVGVSSFELTDSFDPTGEYSTTGWSVLQTMLRTLVVYKFAPGGPGTQLVPDLATEVPTPTDGGLTYTFHLRPGIKFAPPVNREITSQDVAYAFERINTIPLAAQYPGYYQGTVVGMDPSKTIAPISGIETPDAHTIIFHLTKPAGDFPARLTLPAAAPIPPEVGDCFMKPGGYGRNVVSSGPYMIQGSGAVDISSCSAIEPASGFDPTTSLTLVRNPNYDPTTDPASGRLNYVDGIQFTIDTNVTDIFNKIQQGDLDASWADVPPKAVLARYLTDPNLKPYLKTGPQDGHVFSLLMNLTVPPFDDIHVRKAVNLILDKGAMQRAFGGSVAGQIATHYIPPFVLGGALETYDPYATPGFHGSLPAAEAEMKQSQYDTNQDGKCDVSVCENLVMINKNISPWTDIEPIVVDGLAQIGIIVNPRELEPGSSYNVLNRPKNRIPLGLNGSWTYDYPDPASYTVQFISGSISAEGNINAPLVGLTPEMAKSLGIPYPSGGVPSIDKQNDECQAMSGDARMQCFVTLEQYFTEDVVPMAPYLWANLLTVVGSDVTRWESDPMSTSTSFTQVAVDNSLTVSP